MSAGVRLPHGVRTAKQVGAGIQGAHLCNAADSIGGFTSLIAGAKHHANVLRGEGLEMFGEVEIEASCKAESDLPVLEARGHRTRRQAKIGRFCIGEINFVVAERKRTRLIVVLRAADRVLAYADGTRKIVEHQTHAMQHKQRRFNPKEIREWQK